MQNDRAVVASSYNPQNEKTPANKRQGFGISGGPGRNRTTDTRIFNPNKYTFLGVDWCIAKLQNSQETRMNKGFT